MSHLVKDDQIADNNDLIVDILSRLENKLDLLNQRIELLEDALENGNTQIIDPSSLWNKHLD